MYSVRRRATKRSAFTLIELLLVLVILAVLASIVVLNFNSIFGQSDQAKAKTDISNLGTALEMYRAQVKEYPQNLDALVHDPGNSTDWHGPYIQKGVPKDPWGHDYIYVCPGQQNKDSYDLSTNGDPKKPEVVDNWTADAGKK